MSTLINETRAQEQLPAALRHARARTETPRRAAVFIGATILVGSALMVAVLWRPQFTDLRQFASYLVLALLASACKVRLPRLTGTISVNFVVILMGIAELSLPETLLIGAAATVLQCLWKTSRRPTPVQVLFNVAALSLAIAVAYAVPRAVLGAIHASSPAALMAMAIALYFLTNTLLVTGVLSLLEGKRFRAVWSHCYLWALPYYLVGAAIAGLIVAEGRAVGWAIALLILPVMYLVYLLYRMIVRQLPLTARFSSL